MASPDIKVRISADDKTKAGFTSAQRNIDKLKTGAAGLSRALGGLAIPAISTASVTAMVYALIQAGDELDKLAKRTNISVKELAGLELIAQQSDTSLDAMAKGINRLSVSLGEAADDNKEMAKAFQDLGVSAKDPIDALFQLADATKNTTDSNKTNADLMKVLSKSYQELLPLLREGGNSLRESAKASERYAKAMAELSPVAAAFNDNIATLRQELKTTIAEGTTPFIKALNDIAAAYVNADGESIAISTWGERLGNALKGYVIVAEGFITVFKNVVDTATYGSAAISEALAGNFKKAGYWVQQLGLRYRETGDEYKKFLDNVALGVTVKPFVPSGVGGEDQAAQFECISSGGKWIGGKCVKKSASGGGSKADPQGDFVKRLKQEAETLGFGKEALKQYEAAKLKLTGTNAKLAATYIAQISAFKDQQVAAAANNDLFDEFIEKQDDADAALEGSIKSLREWIEQQSFEASLIGLTNAERETAIQLRAVESAGIDTQTEAFKRLKDQITAINETKQLDSLVANTDFSQLKQDQDDMILLTKAFTEGIRQADGSLRTLSETEYLEAVIARLGLAGEQVKNISTFAEQAARNIQDAFADFLFDPFAEGLDGMLEGFAKTIQRMVAEAIAADLAGYLFGSLVKGGSGSGIFGDVFSSIFSGLSGTASANGNVFNSPALSAYSGSVVSKPTVFPFATGIGLMGEAGAEAILPLRRGRNGKLGVESQGGSGTVVHMHINTPDANSFRKSTGQITAQVSGALSRARRNM